MAKDIVCDTLLGLAVVIVLGASLGVPFYRTFWRVTVPIALPSIVAISMYFFLNAMVTLSAVVFIIAPGTELAAVAVLLMDDAGDTAQAAAMSVLIIAIGVLLRIYTLQRVWRRVVAACAVIDIEAASNVGAAGDVVSAFGEGLADGLDFGL